MPDVDFYDLPENLRNRLAASNPQLAQALADRAPQERIQRRRPATRRYIPTRLPTPTASEWTAFDKAQARYLEAAAKVNEAYRERNEKLLVRSNETARMVVTLLAIVILVILALGVAGGGTK